MVVVVASCGQSGLVVVGWSDGWSAAHSTHFTLENSRGGEGGEGGAMPLPLADLPGVNPQGQNFHS